MRRLTILFHGRFPSERRHAAAAIFVAENARAFSKHVPVTIVVPRRDGITEDARALYDLPETVAVVYLPTLNLFRFGFPKRLAFIISSLTFSCAVLYYLWRHESKGHVCFANDPVPAYFASLASRVVYEVHDFPERAYLLHRALFSRVAKVIATNEWKRKKLLEQFPLVRGKILMERNGVDTVLFAPGDRDAARAELGLVPDIVLVVYTGHLYTWKGVETLAEAARQLPHLTFAFVGGAPKDLEMFRARHEQIPNILIIGHVAHEDVPRWQRAADILVLPNTAQAEISAHYTSPMKLFEYLASGRPIVASDLPSIREVLPETVGYFAKPDNPQSFADVLRSAYADPARFERAHAARQLGLTYSWDARASRLLAALIDV